jgi:hypothetical protein
VKGKTVALDVTVSDSRIEDMLRLAVKGAVPLMTGAIALRTQFELRKAQSQRELLARRGALHQLKGARKG